MITFNDLRISDDGRYLIADVEIQNVDIYKDMYIKTVYLDYYKSFSPSIPSSDAYVLYNKEEGMTPLRAKRICFPLEMLPATNFGISDFDKGLFFITVECDGGLPASIANYPCGYDDTTKIGVIVDWRYFYEKGIGYAGMIADTCKNKCADHNGFTDFILQWQALRLAIDVCDWTLVAKLWDKLTNASPASVGLVGGCGCGR